MTDIRLFIANAVVSGTVGSFPAKEILAELDRRDKQHNRLMSTINDMNKVLRQAKLYGNVGVRELIEDLEHARDDQ